MKRFRNFILVLLSIISCICFAVGLSACSNGNNTENTQDKDILAIYNMYVAYAEENNTTPLSYSDWLLTIKGEKGDKGEQGIQGVQGEQGIQGEKGEKGDTGEKGEQGPAGINGTNGTNGKDGINGTNGIDGQDGKSAYEIWLDNGHTGSETDFLNWLKGSDGVDGVNGKDGVNGANGTNGIDGKDGLGIKNVAINDDGDLIITFDNDTTLNTGNVVNPNIKLNDNNKITFNTLEVTENNVYGKVSNETETFSFIKEINLTGNAGYTVYTDLQGTNSIPTKTVSLEIGDNTFYVLETCGNDSNLYTVTIRRKPIYTVSFVTTGENTIPNQQVEEDSLITTTPVLERNGYGYTFDYDITTPITNNTTITATENAIFNIENNKITGLTDYGKTLSFINIPESIDGQSITTIGSRAFFSEQLLQEITIPSSITTIEYKAFYICESLKKITIPNSVTSIGDYAFYKCSSLTSITIPDSVTSIGIWAFGYCSGLTSITISNSIKNISACMLEYCSSLTTIVIPNGVTEIGSYAFCHCSSLTNIIIPESVTSIGNADDNFPVLTDCTSLTNIIVDENNTNYKSIDGNLYNKDGSVLIQYAIGKTATGFVVPQEVTSIENSAFSFCSNLTSVTISNRVARIENYAFYTCKNLTSITYLGTKEEWNNIEKSEYWYYGHYIKTITCTDGTITLR